MSRLEKQLSTPCPRGLGGIYAIVNSVNGKRYVGSAVNIERRFYEHRAELETEQHRNGRLLNSWRIHGAVAFVFKVLIICDKESLIFYEQRAIDFLQPEYNIHRVANSPLGLERSRETREKIRLAASNPSEETRARMRAAKLGKKLPSGHVAKIAAKNRGLKRSEETKARMSAAQLARFKAAPSSRLGKKHSPQTKEKIRQAAIAQWAKKRRIAFEEPGRYSDLKGDAEISALEPGMDFRMPRYRREVFLRFYGFHLAYGTHPGCVYFILPYLFQHLDFDTEEKLWFAYIQGNTQNPVTSLTIWRRWPLARALADPDGLAAWWNQERERLRYDTDRRYFRTKFPLAAYGYLAAVRRHGGNQLQWLQENAGLWPGGGPSWPWQAAWEWARQLPYFGRLSAFSYTEYLRIAGLPVQCEDLMLEDMKGSQSHRNGLCKVTGRDDLDWHASNPEFGGYYSPAVLAWLKEEAAQLLKEAQERWPGRDTGYFTMESALCTFKSWFRLNRRYPNVYADMLYDRINEMQVLWPEEGYGIFWEARRAKLPVELRLEDMSGDPGLVPAKQNHFRQTGQAIMMHAWDPVFRNDFNDRVEALSARGEAWS